MSTSRGSTSDGASGGKRRRVVILGAGGRRVLVIEDGPTITHGGMATGAGFVAASRAEAAEIIDPRPFATGEIAQTFAKFPHIGPVLPAVGYYPAQLEALAATIRNSKADTVVIATPIRLETLIRIDLPVVHVAYAFEDLDRPGLGDVVAAFCEGLAG